VTCDFCDKGGHDASRCWKNPDNPNNRLDSSSDAGPATDHKHKKKACKAAIASKAAARASRASKARKQSAASSSDSCSSDDNAHERKVRLNTAHAVSSALRAGAAQSNSSIILDSGASTHMCPHRLWFKSLRSRERTDILLGDNSSIACDKEGTIYFSMAFCGKNTQFCLDNVLFTPGLKHTLFSCSALASAGYQALVTAAHCTITDSTAQGGPETIARMCPRNGIYYVPAVAHINKRHAAHSTNSEDNNDGDSGQHKPTAQLAHNEIVDRWHSRLGHAGRDRVLELMRNGELHTIPDVPICDACVRGKHSRDSFPGSICTATTPGDVIHSNVAGPLPRSHSGCQYSVSFTDEHSRYVTVFAMKQNSDVLGSFKSFLREFERRHATKIKAVHSDNGGEYTPVAKFAESRYSRTPLGAVHAPSQRNS
jgi:GAG-pre-integrase domain